MTYSAHLPSLAVAGKYQQRLHEGCLLATRFNAASAAAAERSCLVAAAAAAAVAEAAPNWRAAVYLQARS